MNPTNKKIIEYRKKYQNKWVAIEKSSTKVLMSDKNLGKLLKKTASLKEEFVLEKVLPPTSAFIPNSFQ